MWASLLIPTCRTFTPFFWKRFSKLSLNGFFSGATKKVELSFGQNGRPDLNNRKLFSAFSISTIFFSFIREHAFGKISSTLVPLWRTRPKGSTHDDNCRLETTKRWSVQKPLFIQNISLGRWGILSRRKYLPHKFFFTVRALIGFKFLRYSVMVCEPRRSFWLCTTEILRELVSKSNIERQASRWMGLTSLHGPANFFSVTNNSVTMQPRRCTAAVHCCKALHDQKWILAVTYSAQYRIFSTSTFSIYLFIPITFKGTSYFFMHSRAELLLDIAILIKVINFWSSVQTTFQGVV